MMSVAEKPQTCPAGVNPNVKPLFLVLDGIDGCGKSLQLQWLRSYLEGRGRKVAAVHDPGTTPVGIKLRAMLLDGELEMTPEIQTLLYTAARASLRDHIAGLLRDGLDVVCARWVMSTLIYQGVVQKVGPRVVEALHETWVKLQPDAYVVLDLPAEVAQARLHSTNDVEAPADPVSGAATPAGTVTRAAVEYAPEVDRFESRGVEFAEQLRQGYRLFCEDMPNAWLVDADRPPGAVSADILAACALKSAQFAEICGGYHERGCS